MLKRLIHIGVLGLVMCFASCGRTPPDLFAAVEKGDVAKVKQALEAGADARAYKDDTTPLNVITDNGQCGAVPSRDRVAIVKLLLAHGADPNAKDGLKKDDLAPLHFAAVYGLDEIGELLIAAGADVNAMRGKDGPTPLWYAAIANNVGMVKILLAHGADPNARSYSASSTKGMTALQVAARGLPRLSKDMKETFEATPERPEIIRMLLAAGADPAITDANGQTALDLAAANGQTAAAEAIRSFKRDK